MFNEEIFREEEMFREEDLARLAALPTLSPELRVRVLAAVTEARQRRSQGRRVLASLLVLSAAMVWGAWTGPLSIMTNPSAMTSAAPVSLWGTTSQDSSGSAFSIVPGASIVHGVFQLLRQAPETSPVVRDRTAAVRNQKAQRGGNP